MRNNVDKERQPQNDEVELHLLDQLSEGRFALLRRGRRSRFSGWSRLSRRGNQWGKFRLGLGLELRD